MNVLSTQIARNLSLAQLSVQFSQIAQVLAENFLSRVFYEYYENDD